MTATPRAAFRCSLFLPLAALLVFAGCSTRTTVPFVESGPVPTTPQNTVKLFEWALLNRDIESLEELFTADFTYVGVETDSAGNPTREVIGGRDWVLGVFRCMLEGSASRPPATGITLNFDQNLRPQRDTRPDHPDSLFKTIRTSVDLTIDIGDGTTLEVTGYALFYLVRGDTALIPDELRALGFQPDKSRWWISRWEDETIALEGVPRHGSDPTKSITLAAILRMYEGCL